MYEEANIHLYISTFIISLSARYLRDNVNKPQNARCIRGLSRRLYHEESANIMIFLCHLSKDERVLGAMLEAARNLFTESKRFDISKQTDFLHRVNEELPKLVLAEGNPSENRLRMLKEKDSLQRRKQTERKESRAEIIEEPDADISELSNINASFKTIQILGQVLRNFTGSLKGEPKHNSSRSAIGWVSACWATSLEWSTTFCRNWRNSYAIKQHPKSKASTEEEILNQANHGCFPACSRWSH